MKAHLYGPDDICIYCGQTSEFIQKNGPSCMDDAPEPEEGKGENEFKRSEFDVYARPIP